MASLEQLTAACSACGKPVLPRVHPRRREALCIACKSHTAVGVALGVCQPELTTLAPRRLVGGPCVGDLILATMTGRGIGTRAWLSAMLADSLDAQVDREYPIALLLADLEQLGHIEQSPDRQRWWLRPSRWVKDRAHLLGRDRLEIAVGARDIRFWKDGHKLMRHGQPRDDRPPMVARRGSGEDDWTLTLAQELQPLSEWVVRCDPVDIPDDGRPLKRLSAEGVRGDERPRETDIATWRSNGRDVYSVPTAWGRRAVARGVARVLAAGVLPFARSRFRLAIPRDFQPPMPYRRVLTLCSGMLPTESIDANGNIWLVFDGVTDDIFDALRRTLPLHEIQ